MSDDALAYVFFTGYVVVPFVLSAVIRRGRRWLVVVGAAAAAAEGVLAYRRTADVGDWRPGIELATLAAGGALFFFVLWTIGVTLGAALRRRLETPAS